MENYPLKAKLYIWAVVAAAICFVVPAVFLHGYKDASQLMMVLVAAVLAGPKQAKLYRVKKLNKTLRIPVAFIFTFASIIYFGPVGAMMVAMAGVVSSSLYPKRQPHVRIAFNLASVSLCVYSAGYVFASLSKSNSHEVVPIAASVFAYYILNVVYTEAVHSLTKDSAWDLKCLWLLPGLFVAAGLACTSVWFFRWMNCDELLLLIPIIGLMHHSYRRYMARTEKSQKYIKKLQIGQEQLTDLYLATVESLATAIDAKDTYTRERIKRVQKTVVQIGQALGLSANDIEGIRTAAMLHDIGKLGIPEHILLKPGKLSQDEFQKVQSHPIIGAKILGQIQFPWPVVDIVRAHHERYDGKGYPDGLKGEEIPIGARILAVADVFDALTSNRCYRECWTHHSAIDHIQMEAGNHFDPMVVNAFLSVIPDVSAEQQVEIDATRTIIDAESRTLDATNDIARANHELMALFELAQTLSTTLNLEEVLMLLANKIKKVVGASCCAIFLKDEACQARLVAEIAIGTNMTSLTGAIASVGEGKSGNVALSGEPWMGPYDCSDFIPSSVSFEWVPFQSALIVPLFAEEQILGTLNVYHTDENAFSQDDLRVLAVLSKQAGMAVQNARLFEQTRETAYRDSLTGLHNARFLFPRLEQEISRAQRCNHQLAVLGIDLDNFKVINDNLGHQTGDSVLIDVANIFRKVVRDYDLIIRYAGDEFIIVLPETSPIEAAQTASRITQDIAEYAKHLPSCEIAPLGASIGIASYPEDGGDIKTLLAKADSKMYADKRARKGQSQAA